MSCNTEHKDTPGGGGGSGVYGDGGDFSPEGQSVGGRGLNTDTSPRLLAKGAHPQFQNLTYKDGYIRPVSENTSETPSTELTYKANDYFAEFRADDDDTIFVIANRDAAASLVRLSDADAMSDIAVAAPSNAPQFNSWSGTAGLADDETRKYRASWYKQGSPSGDNYFDYVSSPGPVLEKTNDQGSAKSAVIDSPSDVTTDQWTLWVLEDTTGIWRKVGTAAAASSITDANTLAELADLDRYGNPLDDFGDPEVLIDPFTSSTQGVNEHKECLFLIVGDIVYYSEPGWPQVFRQWAKLKIDAKGLRGISWNEVNFIFHEEGIQYVVGSSPFFELREIHGVSGAVAHNGIVLSAVGIFYLATDGLYLFDGQVSRPIGHGRINDWLDDITDKTAVELGAGDGVLYLTDTTVANQVDSKFRVLKYDWKRDEFSQLLIGAVGKYVYDGANKELLSIGAGTDYSMETAAATAVSWIAEYRTIGDGRYRRLPSIMRVECDGTVEVELYIDGIHHTHYVVRDTEEVRLPKKRAFEWYVLLKGTGTAANTVIRDVGIEG